MRVRKIFPLGVNSNTTASLNRGARRAALPRTKIVLADDHRIVRECLRALLQDGPDMQVIGEVGDGPGVADAVARLKPDVLILDLMMPGMSGLEVTRQVKQSAPQVRILILSMHGNENYVREALQSGADGYVVKDESVETLITAIEAVREGQCYLCPSLQGIADSVLGPNRTGDPYDTVTQREREVLLLAAEGHTAIDIAEKLRISHKTVEVHRARILEKLHLRSHTALVKYAIRKGLLPLEK
ncbi:MAG: two component transcriptional regulator, LuxR family [Chthonomonadaceae bacterium]|nr:two component transcriptional regulator, LuxR family [Chthonomonadaceae bacterium]